MSEKVTAVIVTFNRKEMLPACLEAILAQSRPLDKIIIIDNASTDGTGDMLGEKGYLDKGMIDYRRLPENTGGAGGFYEGIKHAFDSGYDWFWLMDDDGVPDGESLKILLEASQKEKADYLSPLVVNIENETELSFGLFLEETGTHITSKEHAKRLAEHNLIEGVANPFNGTLISRRLVQKIGFPKKEMFIWGDENEFLLRSTANGYKIYTVTSALHRHPKVKRNARKIFFGMFSVDVTDSKLRYYCLFRNMTYNLLHFRKTKSFAKFFLKYSWFFLFSKRLNLGGWFFFMRAVGDAMRNDFTRHRQYLNIGKN